MEKGLSPDARKLLEKFKEAGENGLTDSEVHKMGLFAEPWDTLYDGGLIRRAWKKRGEADVKACVITELGESFLETPPRLKK
jgi:hypothetical protein